MDNLPRNDAELAIDPTPLQDAILELLEEAGIAGSINDKIIELVEARREASPRGHDREPRQRLLTGQP